MLAGAIQSLQGRAEVAHLAHNQEVAGSNPAPATTSHAKARDDAPATDNPAGAERVSRAVAGRSATATSERMDVTAGETAPVLEART
jgi:hypothetical protein